MEKFLFTATIDYNQFAESDKLQSFIEQFKAMTKMNGEPTATLNEVNQRLDAVANGANTELLDTHYYKNLYLGTVQLSSETLAETVEMEQRVKTIRQMMGIIFDSLAEDDDTGMSYLTWVVAPVDDLTAGAFGASGGGGRVVENIDVIRST